MQPRESESDLEVSIAQVLENERYRARAIWWERSGLLNPAHYSIHVVRLQGAYRVEDKFAEYYLGLDTAALTSRWYLRADDDSQTNVSGLIRALDRNYSWVLPLHLQCRENHALYQAPFWGAVTGILDELELSHVYEWGLRPDFTLSVTSRSGMQMALACPAARTFIRRIVGDYPHDPQPADALLAIACQIARVPTLQCPFLSCDPRIEEFQAGRLHHVHYVGPDYNREAVLIGTPPAPKSSD